MDELDESSPLYSSLYAIGFRRGQVEEICRLIFRLGEKRLGIPDVRVGTKILMMNDLDELRRIYFRLFDDVSIWNDLFLPQA